MPNELLTPRQLADAIKVTPRTLASWRNANIGPPFVRMNGHGIRYATKDVSAWLLATPTMPPVEPDPAKQHPAKPTELWPFDDQREPLPPPSTPLTWFPDEKPAPAPTSTTSTTTTGKHA